MRGARAALIAAAASLVIAVAPSGAQEPGDLPTTFPAAPRALGGGDPFTKLPGPQECSPARAAAGPRAYFPLGDLPRQRARSPFASGPGVVSYQLTLTNRKRQQYRIYVSAMSNSAALRYIQRASICLERFDYGGEFGPLIDPIHHDELLVTAAAQVAQLTPAQLLARRAELGSDASFGELLAAESADVEAVVDAAAALAAEQLAAKVAAGQPTATEVADLNVRDQLKQLADMPGSDFPSEPVVDSSAARGTRLQADRRNGVVIGMVEVGVAKTPASVIWYAIDPPLAGPYTINKYPPGHNYVAKCAKNVWTQIQATVNSAWVKLTRSGSTIGSAFDSAASFGASPSLTGTSATKKTFDIFVWSTQNNSEYSVFGGWTRGKKGTCP